MKEGRLQWSRHVKQRSLSAEEWREPLAAADALDTEAFTKDDVTAETAHRIRSGAPLDLLTRRDLFSVRVRRQPVRRLSIAARGHSRWTTRPARRHGWGKARSAAASRSSDSIR